MFNSQSAIAAVRRCRTPGQATDIAPRDGSHVPSEKSAPTAETTEAKPATAQAAKPWLSVLWLIFEGYSLYGASLHGFTATAVTAANSEVGARRFQEIPRRERTKFSLVSSSARGDAIDRPASGNWAGDGCETPARDETPVRDVSRQRLADPGWLTKIWRGIAGWWAEWRREREIKKAVAELTGYDDRVLRDMGFLERSQIEQIVRNGRDV